MIGLLYWLALFAFLVTSSEGMIARRAAPRRCSFQPHHLTAFGKLATTRNTSHHQLSLLVPSIPVESLRRITTEELEESANDPLMLAGADLCPRSPSQHPDDAVMLRSLCPWYWRMHYDPKRIPEALPEAVCRCPQAVTGDPQVVYECQPLNIRVRVMKFDEECDSFQNAFEEIAVACVSVMQAVHHQKKLHGVQQNIDLESFADEI